ncbi:MAG: TIGR02281 family clan AA aspartic protease [Gammaproteobacteria bacterium]|nr:TIGR02281 family clan AA aspartic protease [Gammaproteobacteria bacterium]
MRGTVVLAWRAALFLGLLAAAGPGAGAPDSVVVSGLFKDRAVVEIDGRQRLLKVGETSPEGVKLIAADSRRAILEIDGERAEYPLGDRIQTGFPAPTEKVVRVPLSPNGQYLQPGLINGRPVTFQVDTGASAVALSSDLAERIGIDYLKGEKQRVLSASGMTYAYAITLDEVDVGGIVQRNVRAAVLEGQLPRWPLLGMTFLHGVDISKSGTLLELRTR